MKMNQYKWSWWFMLSIIGLMVGMFVYMVAKSDQEKFWSDVITIASVVSFVPCLYVGMKPTED